MSHDRSSTHTEHHTLTLEWADYPDGKGEVTACFCSCDAGPDGDMTLGFCTEWFENHVNPRSDLEHLREFVEILAQVDPVEERGGRPTWITKRARDVLGQLSGGPE